MLLSMKIRWKSEETAPLEMKLAMTVSIAYYPFIADSQKISVFSMKKTHSRIPLMASILNSSSSTIKILAFILGLTIISD